MYCTQQLFYHLGRLSLSLDHLQIYTLIHIICFDRDGFFLFGDKRNSLKSHEPTLQKERKKESRKTQVTILTAARGHGTNHARLVQRAIPVCTHKPPLHLSHPRPFIRPTRQESIHHSLSLLTHSYSTWISMCLGFISVTSFPVFLPAPLSSSPHIPSWCEPSRGLRSFFFFPSSISRSI